MKLTIIHIISQIILLIIAGLLFLQDDIDALMYILIILLFVVLTIETLVPTIIYRSYRNHIRKNIIIPVDFLPVEADATTLLLIIPIIAYFATKTYLAHMLIVGIAFMVFELFTVLFIFLWNRGWLVRSNRTIKLPNATKKGIIIRFIPKIVIGVLFIINAFTITENSDTVIKNDTSFLISSIICFVFTLMYIILLILTITTKRFKFKMFTDIEYDFDDECVEDKDHTYYDYN